MIYISKNNGTEVITENFLSFYPVDLDVYLDDVLIGTFENLSKTEKYLVFEIPTLDIGEKEYKMSIYNHNALIKEELVIVQDFKKGEIKSITKTSKIIQYE